MLKFNLTLFIALSFMVPGYCQEEKISKKDKATLDSMLKNNEFVKMMNDKKGSSLDVSVGLRNGAFSGHNLAVNATGESNILIFTPAVIYHHKSGFGLGVTAYIASDTANSGLYQTGIQGSYDNYGDAVNTGISYTRYVTDENRYNNKSLYQNEFYAYIKSAKGIIRPLITLGYSSGNYKEINIVPFTPQPPQPQITRLVHDSTNNMTSYFSMTGGIEHVFNVSNIFNKNDEMEITPSILLNAGTDKLTTTHTNAAYTRLQSKSKRKRNLTGKSNQKFQLQSIGAALEATYNIGKFFVQPSLYGDYYLPSTTNNRFTFIYSFSVGVSF